MLPHPVTACTIAERRFKEQLRDAAQQRLVASAETRAPSRPSSGWLAVQATISWITGLRMRVRVAAGVLATDPREGRSARSVHPMV
jgi:hypothetical protein